MDKIIEALLKEFQSNITASFHYRRNHLEQVVYPYGTFIYTLSSADDSRANRFGMYIDIDLFSNKGADDLEIEQVVGNARDYFTKRSNFMLTDCHYVSYQSFNANVIETNSDTLQRRTLQVYLNFEERRINYG